MSRVHVSFIVKNEDDLKAVLDVVSPDFSERGTEREVIGELDLDFEVGKFRFTPASNLTPSFCPPEYFERYSGDIDKVDKVCEEEGLMCTAWSYRVYQKAKQEIECKSLDGAGNVSREDV